MPLREVNGTELYFEPSGQGDATLVFSHGLLFSTRMWEKQVEAFKDRFHCITYDHRGQGRSGRNGGRSMDLLTDDVIALIESLQTGPVHFVGLPTGGFVGQRLAARRPDLVRSVALLNTSAQPEVNANQYNMLILMVRLFGVKAISARVLPIIFGKSMLADPSRKHIQETWREWLNGLPKEVRHAVKGVIDRPGVLDELPQITCPTLILAGEEDLATKPGRSKVIAEKIPGSQLEILPGIGHMSNLENPDLINERLDRFFRQVSSTN